MDGDRFLQILSKHFARLKFPTTKRRIISGWAARCCTFASDDVSFKVGQAGFPAAVLAEFRSRGGPVVDAHDAAKPIGKVIAYSILEAGLWVVVQIAEGSKAADQCWADILTGCKRGFSIRWSHDPTGDTLLGGLRLTKASRLLEVSVVEQPSELAAGFVIGRHDNPVTTPTVESPSTCARVSARKRLFIQEVLK